MLTPKQYKLLMFIDNFIKENGCCPSYEEMKEAVGIRSKSGIHALIEELTERDFIKKMPHKARALEVLKIPRFKPREINEEKKNLRCLTLNIYVMFIWLYIIYYRNDIYAIITISIHE